MIALTHIPSPRMQACLRSDVNSGPIDLDEAGRQHAEYCRVLEQCGAKVRRLNVSPEAPDCVFIEDTAVIHDDGALLCSMGHPARRMEAAGVEPILREYREVTRVELPATIDGGDVLRIGETFLVGLSERTNAAGAEALQSWANRFGATTRAIPLRAGLHFKSACTALPDGRLLVNTDWLDPVLLRPFDVLPTPLIEPGAANVVLLGETVIASANFPATADLIRRAGFRVETVPLGEFAKADGAVTCLSLLLRD